MLSIYFDRLWRLRKEWVTNDNSSIFLDFFVLFMKDLSSPLPTKVFYRFDNLSYRLPFKVEREGLVALFFILGASSAFSKIACFFFFAYNAIFKAWIVNYRS
jgi:hypothetical protein